MLPDPANPEACLLYFTAPHVALARKSWLLPTTGRSSHQFKTMVRLPG